MNVTDPITIQITATSGKTGKSVGTPVTMTLNPGQTVSLSPAFQALSVSNTAEDSIIVRVNVTQGTAAIEGIVSQVDSVTKDGAAFEMSRGDF